MIIARSDAARIQGIKEAIKRVNLAADQGADMGLIFPTSHEETVKTPKLARTRPAKGAMRSLGGR